MPRILSIETSAASGSVALTDNSGNHQLTTSGSQQHAAEIAPLVDELVRQTGISLASIDAIAVSEGPGSYTGLRIGLSLAKGMCYGLDKPLIMVSTLECMVHSVRESADFYIPMIDARRMEVFTMVASAAKEVIVAPWAEIVTSESYLEWLNLGSVMFHGDGAAKCKGTIVHPNARWTEAMPDANGIGHLALRKYQAGAFADLIHSEPFYLKEFQTTQPRGTKVPPPAVN